MQAPAGDDVSRPLASGDRTRQALLEGLDALVAPSA
jgi:hypothetical protein